MECICMLHQAYIKRVQCTTDISGCVPDKTLRLLPVKSQNTTLFDYTLETLTIKRCSKILTHCILSTFTILSKKYK